MVVPSNSDKTNSTKQNGKHQGRISIFETQASMTDPCISCTTFNILAPVYKRLDTENQSLRESEYRVYWLTRNQSILDWLLCERSSIICLQEFWVGNEDLVHMYENRLSDAGYLNFKLARTNNRGDGLFTAVNKDYFRVVSYRELLFNDFGDRVAQLLHVESVVPLSQNWSSFVQPEILIVNTHLLFPHNSSLSVVRLHQVYKILQYVESYQKETSLNLCPSYSVGECSVMPRFASCPCIFSETGLLHLSFSLFFIFTVTGMGASVGMSTSSLGRRGLYHLMILLISIPTVRQMLTSGLATAIIGATFVASILYGFLTLISIRNR